MKPLPNPMFGYWLTGSVLAHGFLLAWQGVNHEGLPAAADAVLQVQLRQSLKAGPDAETFAESSPEPIFIRPRELAASQTVFEPPAPEAQRVPVLQQAVRQFKPPARPVRPARQVRQVTPVLAASAAEVAAAQSTDKSSDKAVLTRLLHAAIDSHKAYPLTARRQQRQGRAVVAFDLFPDGRLNAVSLVNSSGVAALDRSAVRAVEGISPFRPAADYLRESQQFQIEIVYALGAG